jgi:hypothetical protein
VGALVLIVGVVAGVLFFSSQKRIKQVETKTNGSVDD